MITYDSLAEAGHEITMIAPILAGVTKYLCENCGAFIEVHSGGSTRSSELRFSFHAPRFSQVTADACIPAEARDVMRALDSTIDKRPRLYDKIRKAMLADMFLRAGHVHGIEPIRLEEAEPGTCDINPCPHPAAGHIRVPGAVISVCSEHLKQYEDDEVT